jgi:hypothetical protein
MNQEGKFEIGDRVRCVFDCPEKGQTATVVDVRTGYINLVVRWDNDSHFSTKWSHHSSFQLLDPDACPQCGETHP